MKTMLLEIKGLSVEYLRAGAVIPAVRDVSLSIGEGECYGLAGESGCGKSTLALAALGLIPPYEGRVSGRIVFNGVELDWRNRIHKNRLRQLRGRKISMIFQDPFSCLNPVWTVGAQMMETLMVHGENPSRDRGLRALSQVALPERVFDSHPHQLSGGQRQRAMIAMALLLDPKLLLLDEPTTALDATIQKEILDLLDNLRSRLGLAMLFITHNLRLLAHRSQRVGIMYAGRIVDQGPAAKLFKSPRHPYTKALLGCALPFGSRSKPSPIPGQIPDPRALPSGCAFNPRCPRVLPRCRVEDPPEKLGLKCFNPVR